MLRLQRSAWFVLSAVAGATVLAAAPGVATGTVARHACPPETAKRVVARTAQAVLFKNRDRALVACAPGDSRRPRVLAPGVSSPSRSSQVFTPRAVGPLVAWGHLLSEYDVPRYKVHVYDVRARRSLLSVPTGAFDAEYVPIDEGAPSSGVGIGPTVGLRLLRDGTVAWIAQFAYAEPSRYEVHVADAGGPRVVAQGSDIDPRSLKLTWNEVAWRQGAQRLAAPLTPRG
jgi:hypothetical protein